MRKGRIPYRLPAEAVNAARFWSKVAPPNENGCRLWTACTRDGYGAFNVDLPDGRYVSARAHRVAYALYHGEAPYGVLILHSCDVRHCCAEEHLRLGTDADNRRDCVERARDSRWKLNPELARTVREMHTGGTIAADIARALGVRPAIIGYVLRGQTWRPR